MYQVMMITLLVMMEWNQKKNVRTDVHKPGKDFIESSLLKGDLENKGEKIAIAIVATTFGELKGKITKSGCIYRN